MDLALGAWVNGGIGRAGGMAGLDDPQEVFSNLNHSVTLKE